MTTKTIKLPITLHVPGPKYRPISFDNLQCAYGGNYDITTVPPWTPVTLDADEADKLLDRYEAAGAIDITNGDPSAPTTETADSDPAP